MTSLGRQFFGLLGKTHPMTRSLKFSVTHASAALIAAIIISFMFFYAANVHAAAPESSDLGKQRRAEALTKSLLDLGQAFQHASPEAKEQALTRLRDVAVERYELLLDLTENDPGTVLRVALPNNARNNIPEALRGYVEQRVEAQGELEVMYEDYEDGTHKLRHYLNIKEEVFSLNFRANPPHLLSGQNVSANGLYLGFDTERQKNQGVDGAFILDSGDNLLLLGDTSTTPSTSIATTSVDVLPNTTGEQKTLVLVFNFANNSSYEPWSLDLVNLSIFGYVNDWFQESSYGQTSFTGDVHGYFTIPIESTCASSDIRTHADAVAQADGVDVLSYDRIIYVYPQVTSCGWGGKGTVGGSPSRAYMNGSVTPDVVVHELGHNFGLLHSHSIDCGSVAIGGTCSVGEYGDKYDAVGSRSYYHFNAFQKERLGWLTDVSGDIVTVNNSGSYIVEPYETSPGTYPKVLKISHDVEQNSWYYLEFRQAVGFDSPLENNANILNGLLFHNASPSDSNSSKLLDMTPNSTSSFNDPALESGKSFTDPITGITVTTGLASSAGIYAEISTGQQSCVRSKPILSFLTTESPWVAAGTEVTYSLSVTNTDSSVCETSSTNLQANLPQGWTGSFSPASVSLNPGQSKPVTLTVTSTGDAVNGFYDIEAIALSSSGTGADTATYIVENTSSNSSPIAVDDSVVLTQTSSVIINVLSNDYDPDQDQILIDSITQGSKGSVKMNADSTLTYTPAKRFKDSDSFTYSIIDGEGGTAAAMVLITLQASSGGDSTDGGNTSKGKGKPTN